ncbi:hypothetical protein Pcinc_040117 [Petrolisthes cinctipes]|uniref:Uncharacterized protein n=1 Tax=Petrolisthes cinctipes TaxID=88211 RepID=A0AAE1EJV6_PETCI|nr:hypothetical protein Pcinc_040117 [Petrolisthes cinctipes]
MVNEIPTLVGCDVKLSCICITVQFSGNSHLTRLVAGPWDGLLEAAPWDVLVEAAPWDLLSDTVSPEP